MNLQVSILVCTYNRSELLKRTIESLLKQNFPRGEFEILVIDNASKDNTKEVVEAFSKQDSRVRYIYEPRLGVAIARNTGAREARAPYIAYFDDDLVAQPDCLARLTDPFWDLKPAPAAVMGKVGLEWEGGRPKDFPRKHETLLSRFSCGDAPRWMKPDEYLLTMNVAFQRETFFRIGGIREDLSRKGRMFICSGDNEVFHRYMQHGLGIYYEPRAYVDHWVPRFRQKKSWLIKRTFGEGTSQVIADFAQAKKSMLLRRFLYDSKVAVILIFKYLFGVISRDQSIDVFSLIRQGGRLSAELQLLSGSKNVKTMSE